MTLRKGFLLTILALALPSASRASCIYETTLSEALEVSVLRCTSAETYYDLQLEFEEENPRVTKEMQRQDFRRQARREPGLVIQARIQRSRQYFNPFPTDGARWTADWQGKGAGEEKFLFLHTTRSCLELGEGSLLQIVPVRECCDTGRGGEIGCFLALPTFDPLPSTLREASP
jgi:hypothetical protein